MDVKISELPESEGLRAGCCFPVVTDDVTYKVTFQQITNQILEAIYPIGSIYLSVNATNPATIFGGSWERIEGKFLLGTSQDYPANSTGGEAVVRLTHENLPAHSHNENIISNFGYPNSMVGNDANVPDNDIKTWTSGGYISGGRWESKTGFQNQTNTTGGNQAHNNMPPYLAVYMWKRIF